MKIITTNIQDFVNSEINEHGFDWVEAQFVMGYEPVLVNGVWFWKDISLDVPVHPTSTSTGSFSPTGNMGRSALISSLV